MAKPKLEDIQKLVHRLAVPFYHLDRDMDIQITDEVHRKENDAEHSWSLALVACSIAPLIDPKLDVGKIAQLAVVHDLVEVYAGDVSIWASKEELEQKKHREEEAFKKIADEFSMFPWLVDNIREYEEKSSDESQFVYAFDKLVPFFFRVLVKPAPFERMKLTIEDFEKGIQKSRKKAHTHPAIGEYFDKMLELFLTHPEYFHSD